MNLTKGILFTFLLFAAKVVVSGQTEKLPPSIQTSGEAIVTVKPDRAQIDIGVVTQAASSEAAVSQNAQKLETTLSELRRLLGDSADIKTVSFAVSPNYRYPKDDSEPTISGYTATNIVRVTLDDLAQIGKVIDTATKSGANRIQNLQFSLKDEQNAESQALREASMKARRKAETIAASLGLKIVRVLSVTENNSGAVPLPNVSYARRSETASTPIESGTIEVRANVTLKVEVNQ